MTTTSNSPATRGLRTQALAVGGAVLATALLWTAAQIMGVALRVDPGDGRPAQVIGLPFTAAVTLTVSLLAWGVRALLDRLTRRAAAAWTTLAVTVLLVSFLPVLYVQASGSAKAMLALMHVAVATVLMPVMGRQKT